MSNTNNFAGGGYSTPQKDDDGGRLRIQSRIRKRFWDSVP